MDILGVVASSHVPEEGGDTPLAVIDFAGGIYTVGATSHTLLDVLSGAGTTLEPDDISAGDGWFAQTSQFSFFGAALESIISDPAGLVFVVDYELVVTESADQLQIILDNGASSQALTFIDGTSQEFGAGLSNLDIASLQAGRSKIASRVTSDLFAIQATGKAVQSVEPGLDEFQTWHAANSYIEANGDVAIKVYSIKFYAGDADMAELVAA